MSAIDFIFELLCLLFLSRLNGKCPLKLWKIPRISSHCPSDTFLSTWSSILHLFFSWKCPLHPHSYSKSVKHLPRLQVLWQVWATPCSFFNNYAVPTYSNKPGDSQRKHVIIDSSSYPASLKTIICASRRDHFTLWRNTLTLASLRGC